MKERPANQVRAIVSPALRFDNNQSRSIGHNTFINYYSMDENELVTFICMHNVRRGSVSDQRGLRGSILMQASP